MALIAASTAGVFLTLVALFTLHAYANHNLHLIARLISYAVEAAVVFANRTATNETLILIASKEEISEASILGNNGKVLASWHHLKDGPLHSMEHIVAHWSLPKTVILPIIHENKLVGEVCLNGHGGSLLRFLMRVMGSMIACLVLLSTLCAMVLSRRMLVGIICSAGGMLRSHLRSASAISNDR